MYTIDIVTICYNSAKTIQRTLDSVRKSRSEINSFIVIDGGSSDGTTSIIKSNIDIVSYYESARDRGIADAFNKGIMRSSADFILLLNADDWLVSGGLAALKNQLSNNFECVCTKMRSYQNDKYVSSYISKPSKLNKFNSVYHPGLLVNKKVYKRIGMYSLDFKIGMDYEFTARHFASGGKFELIDCEIVNFSEGGVSASTPFRIFVESYRIRRKYFGAILPTVELVQLLLRIAGRALRMIGLENFVKKIKKYFMEP